MKCLKQVKEALLVVMQPVYHYEALKKEYPYCVWAEDGAGGQLNADNSMRNQSIQGTIDYYTQQENDVNVEKIQAALKEARISFSLNSIQYEEKERCIHWEWVFEVS